MSAFFTILVGVLAVAFLVFFSRWFRSLSRWVQVLILVTVAAIAGVALTFEFFIYVHERWRAFRQATQGVPAAVVAAFFLAAVLAVYACLRAVLALNREAIARFFSENITPHVREMVRDARTSLRAKRRWWFWRREPDDAGDST